jgi:2-(1,2-epoxy-1,2-dihydrophenyl)acetyl-CoA isomerase
LTDSDAVLREVRDTVLTLTLNLPESRNALVPELERGLAEGINEAGSSNVRALILSGRGSAFCAGASMRELDGNEGRDLATLRMRAQVIPETILRPLYLLEKPVIAAINGWTVGAGIGIALAADYRICSEDARFLFGFRRLALVPDLGVCWMLPRLVGYRAARDMLLRDREVGAREAVELGLADEVVASSNLAERSFEIASELATGPTLALGFTKQMLLRSHDLDLDSFLQYETLRQTILVGGEDHQEGVQALTDRRSPQFEGY